MESRTELRIIATTPGPVRRSTVIESVHIAKNVKTDTQAKNAQPSGVRDFILLILSSFVESFSPNAAPAKSGLCEEATRARTDRRPVQRFLSRVPSFRFPVA